MINQFNGVAGIAVKVLTMRKRLESRLYPTISGKSTYMLSGRDAHRLTIDENGVVMLRDPTSTELTSTGNIILYNWTVSKAIPKIDIDRKY